MEFGNVSSASEDLKSAFRKSPLFLAGFAVFIALALFGLVSLGSVVLVTVQDFLSPEDAVLAETSEEGTESAEEIPVVNAAYGMVTEQNGNSLTLEVETDDAVVPLYFELSPRTEYTLFAYENDDDLVGSETAISRNEIVTGDRVTIYTGEEIGSITPQTAIRVVKLNQ